MQQLYRFSDAAGQLLYIGISLNAAARAAQHKHDKNWWPDVATMTIETHDVDRQRIEAIERDAIKRERPRYNVTHNDDAPYGWWGDAEKPDMCPSCRAIVTGRLVERGVASGRFQYACDACAAQRPPVRSTWQTWWSNDWYDRITTKENNQ